MENSRVFNVTKRENILMHNPVRKILGLHTQLPSQNDSRVQCEVVETFYQAGQSINQRNASEFRRRGNEDSEDDVRSEDESELSDQETLVQNVQGLRLHDEEYGRNQLPRCRIQRSRTQCRRNYQYSRPQFQKVRCKNYNRTFISDNTSRSSEFLQNELVEDTSEVKSESCLVCRNSFAHVINVKAADCKVNMVCSSTSNSSVSSLKPIGSSSSASIDSRSVSAVTSKTNTSTGSWNAGSFGTKSRRTVSNQYIPNYNKQGRNKSISKFSRYDSRGVFKMNRNRTPQDGRRRPVSLSSYPTPKYSTIIENLGSEPPAFPPLDLIQISAVYSETPRSTRTASLDRNQKRYYEAVRGKHFRIMSHDFPALPGTEDGNNKEGEESGAAREQMAERQGIQTSQSGRITNIPRSMIQDQFGLVGLLSFMRAADMDPNLDKVGRGEDLTKLGLDTNSAVELYKTFNGPFNAHPVQPQDLNFDVPKEYLHNVKTAGKLPPLDFSKHCEDLLFYIFYNCMGDAIQLVAATNLYDKGWRYNMREKYWVSMISSTVGIYYYFDASKWIIVELEDYDFDVAKLAPRPFVPLVEPSVPTWCGAPTSNTNTSTTASPAGSMTGAPEQQELELDNDKTSSNEFSLFQEMFHACPNQPQAPTRFGPIGAPPGFIPKHDCLGLPLWTNTAETHYSSSHLCPLGSPPWIRAETSPSVDPDRLSLHYRHANLDTSHEFPGNFSFKEKACTDEQLMQEDIQTKLLKNFLSRQSLFSGLRPNRSSVSRFRPVPAFPFTLQPLPAFLLTLPPSYICPPPLQYATYRPSVPDNPQPPHNAVHPLHACLSQLDLDDRNDPNRQLCADCTEHAHRRGHKGKSLWKIGR